MGNWRTVHVYGTIPEEKVKELKRFVKRNSVWLPIYLESLQKLKRGISNVPLETDPDYDEMSIDELKELENQSSLEEQNIQYFYEPFDMGCGFDDWIASNVNKMGNIGKDATIEEIIQDWNIIISACPDMNITIDVFGEYESPEKVGSVRACNGRVTWHE